MPKELICSVTKKDLDIQTFRAGGKGGQHQNTTDSGVRIVHRESGAVGESRTERSQVVNKRMALRRLVDHPKFRLWQAKKLKEHLTGKTVGQRGEEMMAEKNLKIEVRDERGRWG